MAAVASAQRAELQSWPARLHRWLDLLRPYSVTGTAMVCSMAIAAVVIGIRMPAAGSLTADGLAQPVLQTPAREGDLVCVACGTAGDGLRLKLAITLADAGGD